MKPMTQAVAKEIHKIVLTRLELTGNIFFDSYEATRNNMQAFTKLVDFRVDEVLTQLHTYLWVERAKPIHIIYPKDWWQAFRERWLPSWYLKKHKVIYIEHWLTPARFFPDRVFPKERKQYIIIEEFPILGGGE